MFQCPKHFDRRNSIYLLNISQITIWLYNRDSNHPGRIKFPGILHIICNMYTEFLKTNRSFELTRVLFYIYVCRLSLIAGGAPVTAENHKVLLQSYDLLPAVTKIFTDNTNYLQVWALNAVPNSKNRHLVKINTLAL